MAVSTTFSIISYDGNESTVTPYVISFPFFDSTHIQVSVQGALETTASALNDSDYTVTKLADNSGGSLRTAAAIPSTSTVRIRRIMPLTQPTILLTSGPFPARSVETALDRITMVVQQQQLVISMLATRLSAIDMGESGDEVFVVVPPGESETTIELAPHSVTLAILTTYKVTVDFSSTGLFSDLTPRRTKLWSNTTALATTPEENGRNGPNVSWLVYVPESLSPGPVTTYLGASITGKAWTGTALTGVAATWTVTAIT